jgi:ABC-2 type transport system permease protein
MTRTWAIATREYASFFRTPLGWIVAALFLFLSGLVFAQQALRPGEPASLRSFFGVWWSMLVFIAPSISMRLFAEELRTGTIEPLMSSPVSEAGLATGKFLGALMFLVTCLAPTLVYAGVLEALSRPDYGPIAAGYLGVVLLGMMYLSVGLLFSALTSSQTLAFMLTLFALILSEVGATAAAARLDEPFAGIARSLSVQPRVADFARGIIDSAHVAYFLIMTTFFILSTALALRVRRWR